MEITGASASRSHVEGRRERLHLEVADRDHPVLGDEHERVRLGRVQLDRELAAREPERVACGAVLLGDRPEGERILKVARLDLAALEQRAEPGERRLQARIRPCLADRGVHRVPVRAERLEIERAGEVEDVEKHDRIGERERAVRRREGALVEQRDRLAGDGLEPVEDPVREVGHLRQVALADRPERPDLRQPVVVEGLDEMRRELRARRRRGPGERVCEPKRRRPHDLVRNRRSLRDPVLAHEQAVMTRRLDVEHLPAADAGRDTVRRGARGDRTVDDGAGGRHRRERGGIDLDDELRRARRRAPRRA